MVPPWVIISKPARKFSKPGSQVSPAGAAGYPKEADADPRGLELQKNQAQDLASRIPLGPLAALRGPLGFGSNWV